MVQLLEFRTTTVLSVFARLAEVYVTTRVCGLKPANIPASHQMAKLPPNELPEEEYVALFAPVADSLRTTLDAVL